MAEISRMLNPNDMKPGGLEAGQQAKIIEESTSIVIDSKEGYP